MKKLSPKDFAKLTEVMIELQNEQKKIKPADTVLDGGKKILILDENEKYVAGIYDLETQKTHRVGPPGSIPSSRRNKSK